MKTQTVNTFETCLYCQSQDSNGGLCRYYPPVIAAHLIHNKENKVNSFIQRLNPTLFPVVMVEDIACGAYQENRQMKEICAQ